jgi:hypothetical protein
MRYELRDYEWGIIKPMLLNKSRGTITVTYFAAPRAVFSAARIAIKQRSRSAASSGIVRPAASSATPSMICFCTSGVSSGLPSAGHQSRARHAQMRHEMGHAAHAAGEMEEEMRPMIAQRKPGP